MDVGNSGTGIRLLAGFVSAIDGLTVLQGDASVSRRPMDRVALPLRLMGAHVDGAPRRALAASGGARGQPGGHRLHATGAERPGEVGAAVGRSGRNRPDDRSGTRANPRPHRGNVRRRRRRHRGGPERCWSRRDLRPCALHPTDIDVPADPSQAAFWAVAACTVPGSDLVLEDVYVGMGRAGFIDVLLRMGARLELLDRGRPPPHRGHPRHVRPAGFHARLRAPRSRRSSTRSPCLPWRRPSRRARPASPTPVSCGSRRLTG